MPRQSELSDYEPLTRTRRRPAFDTSVDGPVVADSGVERRSAYERRFEGDKENDQEDRFENNEPAQQNRITDIAQSHSFLKRGHTVSFAGLFLFTLLVYSRPYELLPSLSFLSTVPFWVAVFTLAAFIPTQLGLENKITITAIEVKLVLGLVVAALLSIPLALDRLIAWSAFVEYLKVVAIFIVMVNVVRTEKRLKAIIVLVMVTSCVIALGAVYDYSIDRLSARGDRIVGVIGGLFDNPNDLALHLVTLIPIAVGLLLASKGLLKKIVFAVFAVIFTLGVVVTFSRGGFLGLLIMMSVLMWKLGKRYKILLSLVGISLVFGVLILAPGAYRSRLATTEDDSALTRTDDLKRSILLSIRHPVFGVGMDNYILYSNSNKATHNAYTQVSSELGLAAAALYLWFLVSPMRKLQCLAERPPTMRRTPDSYLAIGLQASLVGYMVCSFFASVAYLWYVYYLVAYAICLRRLYPTDLTKTN